MMPLRASLLLTLILIALAGMQICDSNSELFAVRKRICLSEHQNDIRIHFNAWTGAVSRSTRYSDSNRSSLHLVEDSWRQA